MMIIGKARAANDTSRAAMLKLLPMHPSVWQRSTLRIMMSDYRQPARGVGALGRKAAACSAH